MKVKPLAIVLMVAGFALYGVQALVWRSGSRGRTETDIENRTGHHRVTEMPVIAGTTLLLVAGIILAIPIEDLLTKKSRTVRSDFDEGMNYEATIQTKVQLFGRDPISYAIAPEMVPR
jgi:hypothetical protein